MREDLLYHIWKFRKFDSQGLKTTEGEPLQIIHPGFLNENSGPDFFNSRLEIGGQQWAGNVEIHIKASDWYVHRHECDPAYDNVILHVVWEHDAEIYRKDESAIPVMVVKDLIDSTILENYRLLLEKKPQKINCEKEFSGFSDFQIQHWLERLYFERLEEKSKAILEVWNRTGNDWEATLFIFLAKTFGLNQNGTAFSDIAHSLDFKILQKNSGDLLKLEALLLGQANLIDSEDTYALELKKEYEFLKRKYALNNEHLAKPQFFRLRPDNFPSIRLAQLAALYNNKRKLFKDIEITYSKDDLSNIFELEPSEYWQNHYNFGKPHSTRKKKLTKSFIDLLLINCIIPVKYAYNLAGYPQDLEQIQELISSISAEANAVVDIFNFLKPNIAQNAMESQALVHLKKRYCDKNGCMRCELGTSLLNKSPKIH
ncbi:DUF2851 family protein [Christiangramia salexigens]|uniref:DUF2851 domain-containing protein n=1 Tax=Christiangramia salexigens TaxID=1913577 RepID=A0A1L3J4P4_9FLAO|nr:DUF2851 family protein [Christiangramia salexigens]APG60074.1 hypothetical protein LPB144_06440 [Christiangramia salexigens]